MVEWTGSIKFARQIAICGRHQRHFSPGLGLRFAYVRVRKSYKICRRRRQFFYRWPTGLAGCGLRMADDGGDDRWVIRTRRIGWDRNETDRIGQVQRWRRGQRGAHDNINGQLDPRQVATSLESSKEAEKDATWPRCQTNANKMESIFGAFKLYLHLRQSLDLRMDPFSWLDRYI